MYTSGSTGVPRAVMITHANIATNTRDIIEVLGLTASDRVMVVLPFHYCFGLSLLHTHLAVGGSLVIDNQFIFPEHVLQEMVARECTGLAGVPATYQILLRKSRFKKMAFPSLRWLQQERSPHFVECCAAQPAFLRAQAASGLLYAGSTSRDSPAACWLVAPACTCCDGKEKNCSSAARSSPWWSWRDVLPMTEASKRCAAARRQQSAAI